MQQRNRHDSVLDVGWLAVVNKRKCETVEAQFLKIVT
jgi:hypothetical protein